MTDRSSVYAVVMAGGKGTRLWPESRSGFPKQFLSFDGSASLLEMTIKRLSPLIPAERIFVSGTETFADLFSKTLSFLPKENILLEPCARNTAPTIGWAAVELLKRDPDPIMIVLPSDQFIGPNDLFQKYLTAAIQLVNESSDRLVTLGIIPGFPHTGFGYIKKGNVLRSPESRIIKKIYDIQPFLADRFTEKPPLEIAQRYFNSGRYLWNSGIFIWNARTILDIIGQCEPELLTALNRIKRTGSVNAFRKYYSALKSISIDYAVMEKAKNVVVLPAEFHWDDLGSFISLARLHPEKQDAFGNVAFHTETAVVDSENNIIRRLTSPMDIIPSAAQNGTEFEMNVETDSKKLANGQSDHKKDETEKMNGRHLTALIGVNDLIVVEAKDVLLIVRKDLENKIPELLKKLENESGRTYL